MTCWTTSGILARSEDPNRGGAAETALQFRCAAGAESRFVSVFWHRWSSRRNGQHSTPIHVPREMGCRSIAASRLAAPERLAKLMREGDQVAGRPGFAPVERSILALPATAPFEETPLPQPPSRAVRPPGFRAPGSIPSRSISCAIPIPRTKRCGRPDRSSGSRNTARMPRRGTPRSGRSSAIPRPSVRAAAWA